MTGKVARGVTLEQVVAIFLKDSDITAAKLPELMRCGCDSCMSIAFMYAMVSSSDEWAGESNAKPN